MLFHSSPSIGVTLDVDHMQVPLDKAYASRRLTEFYPGLEQVRLASLDVDFINGLTAAGIKKIAVGVEQTTVEEGGCDGELQASYVSNLKEYIDEDTGLSFEVYIGDELADNVVTCMEGMISAFQDAGLGNKVKVMVPISSQTLDGNSLDVDFEDAAFPADDLHLIAVIAEHQKKQGASFSVTIKDENVQSIDDFENTLKSMEIAIQKAVGPVFAAEDYPITVAEVGLPATDVGTFVNDVESNLSLHGYTGYISQAYDDKSGLLSEDGTEKKVEIDAFGESKESLLGSIKDKITGAAGAAKSIVGGAFSKLKFW